MQIAPSLLAADFTCLGTEVDRMKKADMLHLDVMDGIFVPNLSFGLPVIEALRKRSSLFFDVHLMLLHPLPYIPAFRQAGADRITFHAECADDPLALIQAIRESGAEAGVALKPTTPVSQVASYIHKLNSVTIMTVEPGFGGQALLEAPLAKIQALKKLSPTLLAEVDGGVNRETLELVRQAGTDIAVAGTALFEAENPEEEMDFFRGIGNCR